jgi:hypothetical protein
VQHSTQAADIYLNNKVCINVSWNGICYQIHCSPYCFDVR